MASVTSLISIAVYYDDLYYILLASFTTLCVILAVYSENLCCLRDSFYFQALMRPGRLDRILYVPLPDLPTRRQIFTIHLNRMPTGSTVDVDKLVTATDKYSGAEVISKYSASRGIIKIPSIHQNSLSLLQMFTTITITKCLLA